MNLKPLYPHVCEDFLSFPAADVQNFDEMRIKIWFDFKEIPIELNENEILAHNFCKEVEVFVDIRGNTVYFDLYTNTGDVSKLIYVAQCLINKYKKNEKQNNCTD